MVFNYTNQAISEDTLKWANPQRTGKVLAIGNAVLFTIILEIPLVTMLFNYGVLALLVLGGVGRKFYSLDASKNYLEQALSKESFYAKTGKIYDLISSTFMRALPLFLWVDIKKSVLTGIGMYCCTVFVGMFGLWTFLLFTWNILFVYGKFHKEVDKAAAPHLEKAKTFIAEQMKKIPASASASDAKASKVLEEEKPKKEEKRSSNTSGGKKDE